MKILFFFIIVKNFYNIIYKQNKTIFKNQFVNFTYFGKFEILEPI